VSGPDAAAIEHPGSVPALVAASAERYGDAIAVLDGPVALSFRELASRADEFTRAAIAVGLRPGERVGVWAPNGAPWIVATLGLLAAGVEVVPLNTRYRGAEVADLLARTRASALVVDQGFLGYDHVGALRAAARERTAFPDAGRDAPVPGLPDLRDVITLGAAAGVPAPPGVLSEADFLARAGEVSVPDAMTRVRAVASDDIAYVIFTSGTTGPPKGVLLRHGPLVRVYRDYSAIWGIREGDRYLCPLPFFHTGGQSALLSCLTRGATIVPMAVFDAGELLDVVERLRVTVLIGAPTIFAALLDHPERDAHDLGSLRLAATGAASVPVRLVERARAELPFENFITAYGLTECHGTATMCRSDDDALTVARTNGRALPDTEVRVVDADGVALGPGERGEVCVRGYHVTSGYLDDPLATAAAVDTDGWLHTGDVGVLDERGDLAIVDRLKDLYISGGFNVSPAEVEQVLARHPAVSEAAVVGVVDPRLGEVGRAWLIPKPGGRPDPDEVRAWCRERLANFKVPGSFAVVGELPRNATGKVDKVALRARAGEEAGGSS